MNNSSLISVIMPLYNHCEYVSKAINSVLNQTYGNTELIIVDDGSTDGSSAIAKRFADVNDKVTYVYQQNAGTGVALNTGFSLAKGKYGTWVSSDNIYYKQMLEVFVDFLESHDSSFVFSSFDSSDGSPKSKIDGVDTPVILTDFIKLSTMVCITGMCYLYTMSLKNECGDYLDVPGEDYYMGVSMGFKTAVGYIPTPLGMYRKHSNSVSGRLYIDSSGHVKNGGMSAVEQTKRLIVENRRKEKLDNAKNR